jgi:hypothetical protein
MSEPGRGATPDPALTTIVLLAQERVMAEANPIPLSLPSQFPHEYQCWKAMRGRCRNPNNPSWRYYGGKGVKVCARWDSFAVFLEDVGAAPTPAHQIDRMENDRDYEPGNCHWSTAAEQQANTSKVRFLTYRGVTLAMADWCAILDLPSETLRTRIDRLGWDIELAMFAPIQELKRNKAAKFRGGERRSG